jgi:hypothetical protein
MDAQDKKSKDWTLFGRTEDNAIARAKYKREMGINPKAKTESSAEVSRSAKSMKNPTSRPYDPKDSAKVAALRKKEPVRAVGGQGFQAFGKKGESVGTILRHGSPVDAVKLIGSMHSKKYIRDAVKDPKQVRKIADVYERDIYGNTADRTPRNTSGSRPSGPKHRNPLKSKPSSEAPAASGAPPKPRLKPDRSGAATVRKAEGPKAASGKSAQPSKMTSFQRMKARQFEKEGVAGRSMSRSAAQKKAMEKSGTPKMSGLLSKLSSGVKKAAAPKKKDKPAGKSKSELAAWFRSKRQGLAK